MNGLNSGTVGDVYVCYNPIITLTGNDDVLEAVEGNHKGGKGNADVERLIFANQDLPSMPKNLGNFFPNLASLSWGNTNLDKVSVEDFKPFPKLRELVLHQIKLKSLNSDLFKFNLKLEMIFIKSSLISNIGEGIFDNLNSLRSLTLLNNTCINEMADGRQNVIDLISKVKDKCPSLPTFQSTTLATDTCELKCDEILKKINAQEQKIQELNRKIADYDDRFVVLEKIIREAF